MLPTMLFAALSLAPAGGPAANDGKAGPLPVKMRECPSATVHMADQPNRAVARRLDELPPGRLELTVLREVNGCPIPAVLREGIGGRR